MQLLFLPFNYLFFPFWIRNKLDPCRTKFHTINSNEPTAATAQQDLPDRMLYHQQYTIL